MSPATSAANSPAVSLTVRVELPSSLRQLARTPPEIQVTVQAPATQRNVLDQVEALYPALLGTIRESATSLRRPFIRFFACGHDLSHQSPDEPLPAAIAGGREALLIVGAIAGG